MSSHELVERFKAAKPFFAVVFLQFGLAGMDILCKAALNEGVSNYVLVVYRHAVATLVVAPFAVVLDKSVTGTLNFMHTPKHISGRAIETKPVFDFVVQKSKAKDDTCNLHQDNGARLARVIF